MGEIKENAEIKENTEQFDGQSTQQHAGKHIEVGTVKRREAVREAVVVDGTEYVLDTHADAGKEIFRSPTRPYQTFPTPEQVAISIAEFLKEHGL